MKELLSKMIAGTVSATLGIASMVVPVFVLELPRYEAPLFSVVQSGIEGLSLFSVCLLFTGGVVTGFIFSKHPLLAGGCAMAAFPLIVFAEIAIAPTSHNLWPIEFVIYALLTIPALVGAYAGEHLRSLRRR